MKTSVYVGTSLDGFIARENHDLDWLTGGESAGGGEDYGYQAFFDTVDVLVMGRGTYDKVLTFGSWPYGDTPVVVLSHHELDRPPHVPASVERASCSPSECVARLRERGFRHAYIDGGRTIQEFLRARLIDRITISRVPVLIGSGIPLFGPLDSDVRLRHVATRSYPSGLVQSEYEILED